MDNASYHSRRVECVPTKSSTKSVIQEWLSSKGIDWDKDMLKVELISLVSQVRHKFLSYRVDTRAETVGCTVLRLPPYHCELNPIELIWGQVKNEVARSNSSFKLKDVKVLLEQAIKNVTKDNWTAAIQHVKKMEKQFWENDSLSDREVAPIIIEINAGDVSDDSYEDESCDEVVSGSGQPHIPETSNVANTEESPSTSCWKLLLDRLFLPDLVTIMMCWAITGFSETTLEPSLRTFGLSRTEIGKLYAVQYASSMIRSVVAGISCYFKVETFFCFVGQIFAALAYLLVGPAPFIPYERALWMVYLAQAFIGLAMSLIMTCAYCHTRKVVTLRGCPDTIQTKGFVSSSLMVAMMIGGLVLPPLAGYIVEQVGYRTGTMALFGLFVGWIPVTFALWAHSLYWPGKHKASSINSHSRVPAEADA
ncbi:uncharacterized protein LOC121836460 [Ixodes scapularis]|uniref:uncharacterized protein LOC121836460 n=1 Tax=Ixodes scapularis TaxID=6945 RepID=UPI001C387FB2|nr:uncharacterized protein LOC121836460 [Ixodes scapularis]